MNWDPFQREVLAELGHRLYRVRGGESRAPHESPGPAASTATVDPLWRALLVTGFLGALTTFSTFSAEVLGLLLQSRLGLALGITLAHVAGSIAAAWAGLHSAPWLWRAV